MLVPPCNAPWIFLTNTSKVLTTKDLGSILYPMIIDCHTHIGFGHSLVASCQELIGSMKKSAIDKALVYAGEINDCSTERLLDELKDYPKLLYPVGSISPFLKTKPPIAKIEKWLKNKQIFGLKFYLGYEPFYPEDKIIKPYLDLLVRYNRPAIFHCGDTYNQIIGAKLKYAHPFNIDELAVDMPQLKIIIAHLGYPWIVDTAEICLKNKNVYTDCSGLVYGEFKEGDIKLFERICQDAKLYGLSWDKLLFGTDWPISNQDSYVKIVKKIIGVSNEIFYINSLKVFGI